MAVTVPDRERSFDSRADTVCRERLDTERDAASSLSVAQTGTWMPPRGRTPRPPSAAAAGTPAPSREPPAPRQKPRQRTVRGEIDARPRVLVADVDRSHAAWLSRHVAGLAEVAWVASAADAARLLRHGPVPVLIVGEQLADVPRERLIEAVATRTRTTVITVSRSPSPAAPPQGVYYQLDRSLDGEAVRQVVTRALAQRARPGPGAELTDPVRLGRLAAAARGIALQRSASDVARAIAAETPDLVDANRATCLFFDADAGLLWSGHDPDQPGVESPIAGVVGFAARTGAAVFVERAAADPRYRKEIDDPGGSGDERLAAVPIVDPNGEAHAVVLVARDGRAPAFDAADRDLLLAFAARIAPVLDAFALEAKAESLQPAEETPFRPEAVAAYKARKDEGGALRLAPRWAAIVYWVLIALVTIGVAYLCVARINDYAEGPAVVLAEGQEPVVVRAAGTVSEIRVAAGDRVVAGQELVRLYDAAEAADLASIEQQFEQALVERLQRPEDPSAATALASLAAQRDRARHGVAERTLRAPAAGVVGNVRLRAGQPVTAGQEALTIVSGQRGASVIAFLPASYAPLMKPGLTVRLELDGHPRAYQKTTVESFATHASGPAAISQFLGDQLGDAVKLPGAVVMIRGRMASDEFVVDGKHLGYRHGMTGRVAVRVRSQRMILSVIPGLKEVFGYDYD